MMHLPESSTVHFTMKYGSVKQYVSRQEHPPHQGAALTEPQARTSSQTMSRTSRIWSSRAQQNNNKYEENAQNIRLQEKPLIDKYL
jgi:hypothetical protein